MTQQEFFSRYTYNIRTDKIGGGGFGTVYKAYDNTLHRDVAIKVSEVKTAASGKTFSLKDEFEALSGLPPHPNIANYESLYSFEMPFGIFDYAVMQFYPDGNLSNLIKTGLDQYQKEDIARQLLDGVAFLHQHNVVHRDLKPGNILIVKHGGKVIPLITDFGLSKTADTGDRSMFSNSFGGGTARYSSPEQLQGQPLRLNTDLWSYGVIVYELFTGRPLFDAGSSATNTAQADLEIYNKIISGNTGGRLNDVPMKWRNVLERCLVVNPANRVKSAGEIFAMLANPDNAPSMRDTPVANNPADRTSMAANTGYPSQTPVTSNRNAFDYKTSVDTFGNARYAATPSQGPTTSPRPAYRAPASVKPKRKKWLPWVIVGSVLLFILIVVSVLVRNSRDDDYDYDYMSSFDTDTCATTEEASSSTVATTANPPSTPAKPLNSNPTEKKEEDKSSKNSTSDNDEYSALLASSIKEANRDFPEKIDDGMTLTKMYIEGNYVVYDVSLDEAVAGVWISDIRESKNEVKQAIKKDLLYSSDSDIRYFLSICGKCKKGIAYRYKSKKTGESVTIYINPNEL